MAEELVHDANEELDADLPRIITLASLAPPPQPLFPNFPLGCYA